jgi:hypothetical protein
MLSESFGTAFYITFVFFFARVDALVFGKIARVYKTCWAVGTFVSSVIIVHPGMHF